jgi:hypothetical protein
VPLLWLWLWLSIFVEAAPKFGRAAFGVIFCGRAAIPGGVFACVFGDSQPCKKFARLTEELSLQAERPRLFGRAERNLQFDFPGDTISVEPAPHIMQTSLRVSRAFILALLATTLGGCLRPPNYTVARRGSDTIALPPHADPTAAESHFEASIKNVRSHPSSNKDCAITDGPIAISWHGRTAEAQLDSTESQQPAAYAFQRALDGAQSKGCLGSGEEYRLDRALTERLPLSSSSGPA